MSETIKTIINNLLLSLILLSLKQTHCEQKRYNRKIKIAFRIEISDPRALIRLGKAKNVGIKGSKSKDFHKK